MITGTNIAFSNYSKCLISTYLLGIAAYRSSHTKQKLLYPFLTDEERETQIIVYSQCLNPHGLELPPWLELLHLHFFPPQIQMW